MADAMRAQLEAMQVEQGRSEQGMPSAEAIEEPSTPTAFEEGGVEEVDVRGAAAKREATLEECVSLLRAPKDEQRFVGLLLVTRFLQGGDEEGIRTVFEAMEHNGTFLNKLLKGSRKKPGLQGPQAVAVAVCSALVRLPDIAASDMLVEKVPLFLNVLRLAVQLAAMDYTSGGAGAHSVGPAEAASIAADAAECLLGVAVASSLGREVAVQSGALGATAQWLAAFPSSQLAAHSRAVGEAGAITTGLRLQGILAAPAPNDRGAAISASPAEAEAAAAEAARALSSAPGSPASLEALHSLLFLLPLCAPLRNPAPPWAAHAQRGLAALLSNQLPSQQRAMALRAAASAVEAAGPLWVAPAAGSGAGDGAEGGVLVAVLTQSVRVELTVTLHELERPHAHEAADALVQAHALVCACFTVLEAVIEVLSLSQEEPDDSAVPCVALPDSVATVAVTTLHELVGLVLEHLEERFLVRPEACDAPNDGSPIDSTAGGSIHGLMVEAGVEEGAGQTGGEVAGRVLVVACVRVLGCFLAQMPECFAGRVRALLEHMLCAGGAVGAEGEPVAFLLPFLRQVTSPFGEEGAAGARQTCAAMLTSAPAVTALRAFLHTELNAPTAHTRAVPALEDALSVVRNLLACPDAAAAAVLHDATHTLAPVLHELDTWATRTLADPRALSDSQEAPLGTALALATLVSRRPPPTGTLQPEDIASYLDRFLGQ